MLLSCVIKHILQVETDDGFCHAWLDVVKNPLVIYNHQMKKILFIGDCGNFGETSNGVYAKNIQLLSRLNELSFSVKHVNTNNWKKNPCILIKVAYAIWQYRKVNIIISLNTYSSYKLIKIVWRLFPSIRLNYFVIGGILPTYISRMGEKRRACYSIVKWFMVESNKMKQNMELLGFRNVLYVPNFKKISYIPAKQSKDANTFKFVFLSRIIPEKGCGLIIEAAKRINEKIGGHQFVVHFYGKIDDEYRPQFTDIIKKIPNLEYKGFLNLSEKSGYDVLAGYSVMLFPTFWKGEGFPGILIDAMIAGLPVVASEWGYNAEIIENGKTGLIIESQNVEALVDAMKLFISNKRIVDDMAQQCRLQAVKYDAAAVLTKELFRKILNS